MPYSLPSVMTTFPVRVDAFTTVSEALALLSKHGFHHLPVSSEDTVIGVVSQAMLEAVRIAGGGGLKLRELCHTPPVAVPISTPLGEVAEQMRRAHSDAAVVLARGRLAGIVTTTDICAVLIDLIPGPPPPTTSPPDVA